LSGKYYRTVIHIPAYQHTTIKTLFLKEGKSDLKEYGCPNGTLASELGKNNALPRELSQDLFDLIHHWLEQQFINLGGSPEQANDKALELFSRGQGICVFAQVYNDETLFLTEIDKLKQLIHTSCSPTPE